MTEREKRQGRLKEIKGLMQMMQKTNHPATYNYSIRFKQRRVKGDGKKARLQNKAA